MGMRSGLFMFLLFMVTACDQSAQVQKVEHSSPNVSEVRKIEDPVPNASEVRLFVEVDYDKNSGEPIFNKKNGVVLSATDRVRFEDTLRFVATPEAMAACFIPHHFFRYFDNEGKQVGEVAVCFCCAGTASSGSDKLKPRPDEILDADLKALKNLVLRLGEPTQVLCQ